ncbi:sensor domain-containing diguanylate cyclase [Desulfobaculum bizertense]|uniref:diguanylate cyclase n=1 Tax=Desulfobaculum bizertense DSM 18034 TaxID=1121442 RepID=A0A1T4W102_9BACT|nr:GGDEF domain-containing protein [Desulfobaculum bizertense]UIJ38944.1 GGDEF domain-containing protein [Desulfobaculum bizertense]SKA70932.1 diguanylate cyclase (GGDEF) domain-containing protein [Desulfobaculum bizertense DSM 18034]
MQEKQPKLLLGLGLNDFDRKTIEGAVGHDFALKNVKPEHLSTDQELPSPEASFVTWIPVEIWDKLTETQRKKIMHWETVQKILLLGNSARSHPHPEQYLEMGFLAVLSTPLKAPAIRQALEKAREVKDIYEDILRMTQEISLDREVLARKNAYLEFLNRVMSHAAESLNPATIITQAWQDLNTLFDVSAAQCIFWHPNGDRMDAELFLALHENNQVQEEWTELLLQAAREKTGTRIRSYQLSLMLGPEAGKPIDVDPKPLSPSAGYVSLLPLKAGGSAFGCLALLTPELLRLGKEQRDVLHSAVNHIALALKNALLFREVKIRADHDGLTRIYNRQYFDRRLTEELERVHRYDQDLSILLMDIDHFKNTNDSYGHQAGDKVLKKIGALLLDGLRSTDFPSRYGGEEFAILLPHTNKDQAWKLAERIRQQIEALYFRQQGACFSVTVSIGVAHLDPQNSPKNMDLLFEADQALYLAKAMGRNMVCGSDSMPKNQTIRQAIS